jgi:tripartite ATP-independent transporter DctM subunit
MIAIMVVLYFALMLVGVPIAVSIALSSLVYIVAKDIPLAMAAQRFFSNTQSFPFLAVPFFILSGNIMVQGGVARRLIKFADSLVRPLPGGLALVSVITSMIFAGISGSSAADAAGIGSILIPSMKEKGYDSSFSCAINATTSIVGIIIPPSSTMVILGWLTGISIAKMFLGGAIPGILISVCYFIITIVISLRRNYPREKVASIKEILANLKGSFFALVMPLIIVGGIVFGIATVTEIAAAAAVYSLIISLFVYRSINLRGIFVALKESAYATSIIMFIVGASNIFTWILIREGIPKAILAVVVNLHLPNIAVLFTICGIMLIAGTFIEMIPNMFLFVPVFMPVAVAIGMDPVHFGVLMIIVLAIGMFTPPVGTTLYISCHIAKIEIEDCYKDLVPFFLGALLVVALVLSIPSITMFLPTLLFK